MSTNYGACLPGRAFFCADESLFSAHECPVSLIESLLREHLSVRIPALSFPLVLTRPIRLESGMYLNIHESTILRMAEGCGGCMVRNANIHSGIDGPIPDSLPRDADIIIEGGQWEDSRGPSNPYDDHPAMQEFGRRGMLLGAAFFSHAERVTVRNMLVRRSTEYAVLLADCRKWCDDHGINYADFQLRRISASILGLKDFKESAFEKNIEKIVVLEDGSLEYHFYEGRTETWQRM